MLRSATLSVSQGSGPPRALAAVEGRANIAFGRLDLVGYQHSDDEIQIGGAYIPGRHPMYRSVRGIDPCLQPEVPLEDGREAETLLSGEVGRTPPDQPFEGGAFAQHRTGGARIALGNKAILQKIPDPVMKCGDLLGGFH